MHVEAVSQCDAIVEGGRKALFPGQRYELPDHVARPLLEAGLVKLTARTVLVPSQTAPKVIRAKGRPRARK